MHNVQKKLNDFQTFQHEFETLTNDFNAFL